MGENKAQWPDYVRRRAQQHLSFHQGFSHEREIVVLEITQAAMNELRAGRGSV